MAILIVDDNEQNLYQLQVLLKGHGYEVVSASNGAEALEKARHEAPDLIVSDILMPVMDGFALCREWKRDEKLRHVPFIFYTATYTDERDRDFALGIGADEFIVKPAEADVFLQKMREVIRDSHGQPAVQLPLPEGSPEEEEARQLKEYSAVLIRKLEDKMAHLEQVNRQLAENIDERRKVENDLRESEARLRVISDNAPTGIILVHAGTRTIRDANPAALAMLGRSREEVIGNICHGFFCPAERSKCPVCDLGQQVDRSERIMLRTDGGRVPILKTVVPITFKGETYLMEHFIDISERKKAEESLRQSAEARRELEAIVNKSPAVVFLWRAAEGWPVEYVSESVRQFGYSPDDFYSGRIPYASIIHPNDLKRVGDEVASCSRDKDCEQFSQEYRLISPSGDVHWIDDRTWLRRNDQREITHYQGIILDITERKKAEEKGKESEERYREFFAASRDCVFITNASGQWISFNDAALELFGYGSREELAQTSIPALYADPATRAAFLKIIEKEGYVKEYPIQLRRKDGAVIDTLITAGFRQVAPGADKEFYGTIRDVTSRKRADEELHRINRALRMISACNEVLVRATEEAPLLDDICRLIVEVGGYLFAWVGFAEADVERTVRPVARAGKESDYLKSAKITWDDTESGRGPTGTAIRTGKVVVVSDTQTDPTYSPWREAAAERGYRSSASFPLLVGGAAIGALCVYAKLSGAFSNEEIKLLTELANDLAYGIHALRSRAAHLRAEEELRFRNVILSTQQEATIDGILIVDENSRVLSANSQFAKMWKIPPEIMEEGADELVLQTALGLVASPKEFMAEVRRLYAHRTETSRDEISLKDGRTFDRYSAPMLGSGGKYYGRVWYFRDITERKHADAELRDSFERTRAMMNGTVEAISSVLEVRDPYTAGHERRVSQLASALAAAIGWDAQRVEGVRIAGYMHDIGKVAVPAEILSKPGRINELEMGIIRSHPQCGYDILKKISFPWPIALVTLQHHERLDGSGYPQQLKGDEISIEARLLAIADVVEAMSSHRPYRAAHSVDDALAEVGKENLYDRDIAAACRRLIKEDGFQLT